MREFNFDLIDPPVDVVEVSKGSPWWFVPGLVFSVSVGVFLLWMFAAPPSSASYVFDHVSNDPRLSCFTNTGTGLNECFEVKL